MAYTFLHMGCNQDIARWVASQTYGIRILDSQYAGLKFETEHTLSQMLYFRCYYELERMELEHKLMDRIDADFETDNINPDADDDEHCF